MAAASYALAQIQLVCIELNKVHVQVFVAWFKATLVWQDHLSALTPHSFGAPPEILKR